MSPLAAAVLAILESEREYPPLSAGTLARVLHVTGRCDGPDPISEARVEAALEELLAAALAESSWRLGVTRYRVYQLDGRGIIDPGEGGRCCTCSRTTTT